MSAERKPPRVLRPRPWLLALVMGAAATFVTGALFSYRHSGWSWTSIGFAAMSVLAGGGILEFATSRIILREGTLESGSLWSRRRYAAEEIASVTWEAGGGVSVKLANGGWAKLPELGYNAQGLTNTLRAWLKRARPGAISTEERAD